jgi:hypothetical protein
VTDSFPATAAYEERFARDPRLIALAAAYIRVVREKATFVIDPMGDSLAVKPIQALPKATRRAAGLTW